MRGQSGQPWFTVVSLVLEGVLLNWKGGYCMGRGWGGHLPAAGGGVWAL